jgi:hypothetical protein
MCIKHRTIAKGVLAALKLTGAAALALPFITMLVLAGCPTEDDSGGEGGGVSWTAVADSTFGYSNSIYGIAYGGASGSEKFVAVGVLGNMAYWNGK